MDLELEPLQLEDVGARKGKENLRQRKNVLVVKHVETFLQIMNNTIYMTRKILQKKIWYSQQRDYLRSNQG